MGVQLTWLDVGWLSGRVGSDVFDDLGKRPPGRANLQSGFAIPQLQCNPTKRRTRVVQVWGDNCATSGSEKFLRPRGPTSQTCGKQAAASCASAELSSRGPRVLCISSIIHVCSRQNMKLRARSRPTCTIRTAQYDETMHPGLQVRR